MRAELKSSQIPWRCLQRLLQSGASFVLLVTFTGCAALRSNESALNPAGPQAQKISALTWLFIIVCLVVYVLVMLVLAGALLHRRRGKAMAPNNDPITEPDAQQERRIWTTVGTAIAITVVTLFVLLIGDFITGRHLQAMSEENPEPLKVKIIAHQWWWGVQYTDWPARFGERIASHQITTANEIHVPVDPDHPVAVEFELESSDVIHSFWLPSLNGKKDIVPGHPTTDWLRVDRVGTYYGECGEYCGYQHAQMRLVVVAEPPEKFQAWLDTQRSTAPEPSTDVQRAGRNVFLHGTCAMCHAIQGTDARGRLGPDLTHLASRKVLASGAIPNAPGHLAGWIIDPQRIKPGVHMPQNNLVPHDLRNLLEYLETLK